MRFKQVCCVVLTLLCVLPELSRAFAQDDGQQPARNSTRKIRVEPNEQASRIGSAVDWQADFGAAVAKSKETGKPIFWYVPTLRGTFMDRKNEIDRYMLAGPFSWPDVISVINEHYIPVRSAPTPEQQETLDLVPYKFVEPGFLIIAADGTVESKVDRITTMPPVWFRKLLTHKRLQPIEPHAKPAALKTAWDAFSAGKYADTLKQLEILSGSNSEFSSGDRCESTLLTGMAQFRMGQHQTAEQTWEAASKAYPDEPLAWKAAAEAQGIGPFVRGFETHGKLSERALQSGIESAGSQAPPNSYTEAQLWHSGIEFLLGMQSEDGGFKDSDYDFGGTDSLPNVHVAVTSLAAMAMLSAAELDGLPPATQAKLIPAIDRAIAYVTDAKNINRADRDEILWAYAYRLRFLARCSNSKLPLKTDRATLTGALASATDSLEQVQSRQGNWYHEYNNPFVTATALAALYESRQMGADVDQSVIDKGLKALGNDRFGNGAYPYSSSRGPTEVQPGTARHVAASAGRMPICELGLWYWGKSSDEFLDSAVQRSLGLQENLDIALKYDDHTSRLAYGGFFFWYDMRGRAEAISQIADAGNQAKYREEHKQLILALPEIDGCFVDSHELGRVYGTAMALLSLAYCK